MRQIYTAFSFNDTNYSNIFNVTLENDLYTNQLRGSREVREEKIPGRDIPYFYDIDDQPLEFDLTLALAEPVSAATLRTYITTFLNQTTYGKLNFGTYNGTNYSAATPDFYVIFTGESTFEYTYKSDNKYLGYFNLKARCNAPYGFTTVSTQTISFTNSIATNINTNADISRVYPVITITAGASNVTDYKLENATTSAQRNLGNFFSSVGFTSIKANEQIIIDTELKTITTNSTSFPNVYER